MSALQAILSAYERTKDAPHASIPTPLMLAIENAKRLQESASPYAERRREPRCRPDMEMTTSGEQLRPGT